MRSFLFFLFILSYQAVSAAVLPQSTPASDADSVRKQKKVSFYDTSAIYTQHWNQNVTFAYANEKYDASALLRITDSIHGYAFPIEKETTSGFGRRHGYHHYGIDIPLHTGEAIVAAFDGKVRYASYNSGGFGNLVIIRHPNGLETYYAHLSKVKVKVNQVVKAGQTIGLGGSTGRSYSPHLHFEVRYHDKPIDPEKIFDTEGYCLKKDIALISDLMQPAGSPKRPSPVLSGKDGEVYAIRSGDTLSKIAAQHGTTVEALCDLNGLSRSSVLQIGQQIRVN